MAKWHSVTIGLVAATLDLSGCSGAKGESVQIRDEAQVKKKVHGTSSQLLDIMGVKGKVSEPGPSTLACSDYPDDQTVHRMRHPWSVYGVPDDELRRAMDRLRDRLPRNGWKITKDGVDSSRSKSPQIIAESSADRLAVDIRLGIEPAGGEYSSMIEVTVSSDCFRSQSADAA